MALEKVSLETYGFSVREFASADPQSRSQYLLDPPYQRGAVWDDLRRRNLIRSLLMGLPIGSITINERTKAHEQYSAAVFAAVVDGRQRIETLRAFVDSVFPVPASWFDPPTTRDEVYIDPDETLEKFDDGGVATAGVLFGQLTDLAKRLVLASTVTVNHAKVNTVAAEAELFLLINYGGVNMTDLDRGRAEDVASQ